MRFPGSELHVLTDETQTLLKTARNNISLYQGGVAFGISQSVLEAVLKAHLQAVKRRWLDMMRK